MNQFFLRVSPTTLLERQTKESWHLQIQGTYIFNAGTNEIIFGSNRSTRNSNVCVSVCLKSNGLINRAISCDDNLVSPSPLPLQFAPRLRKDPNLAMAASFGLSSANSSFCSGTSRLDPDRICSCNNVLSVYFTVSCVASNVPMLRKRGARYSFKIFYSK